MFPMSRFNAKCVENYIEESVPTCGGIQTSFGRQSSLEAQTFHN